MADIDNNNNSSLDYMADGQQQTAANKGGKISGSSHKLGKADMRDSAAASSKRGRQRGQNPG